MKKHKPTFIESISEKLGIIENLHAEEQAEIPRLNVLYFGNNLYKEILIEDG